MRKNLSKIQKGNDKGEKRSWILNGFQVQTNRLRALEFKRSEIFASFGFLANK